MLITNDVGQANAEDELWALGYYGKLAREDERCGPCEDDPEVTAPYIDGMPDGVHCDEFLSRPLKFEGHRDWERAMRQQREHDEGVLASLYASDMDALLRRARREAQAKR